MGLGSLATGLSDISTNNYDQMARSFKWSVLDQVLGKTQISSRSLRIGGISALCTIPIGLFSAHHLPAYHLPQDLIVNSELRSLAWLFFRPCV